MDGNNIVIYIRDKKSVYFLVPTKLEPEDKRELADY
jgi:hypothetical protein